MQLAIKSLDATARTSASVIVIVCVATAVPCIKLPSSLTVLV